MRSSFIFCLLAMCYIASANPTSCWDLPGFSCLSFCYGYNGGEKLTTRPPGTPCTVEIHRVVMVTVIGFEDPPSKSAWGKTRSMQGWRMHKNIKE
uniref:Putative secreted protein n=1 Tax=Ixodes ricinus TaxID=34613 RepID=V5ICR6_IXORI